MDNLSDLKMRDFWETKKRVDSELEYDEYNVKEENRTNGPKHHYWITQTYEEKDKLNLLHRMKRELRSKLYLYFRFGDTSLYKKPFQYMVTSWTEIQILIKGDKRYLKLDKIIKRQEAMVEYLEKVERLFGHRYFAIRNTIQNIEKEKMGQQ